LKHNTSTDVLIVGSGIAGLAAARQLLLSGFSLVVLDKGRNTGGRMASRHVANALIDHGAQHFSVRDPWFQEWVDSAIQAGAAKEWPTAAFNASTRYIGSQGMRNLMQFWAEGLPIEQNEQVVNLKYEADLWQVETQSGKNYTCKALLLTQPLPQALQLLQHAQLVDQFSFPADFHTLTYTHCLALLCRTQQAPNWDSVLYPYGVQEPFSVMVDNLAKGISKEPAISVHFNAECSLEHYEDSEEQALAFLSGAVKHLLPPVIEMILTRWRYSQTEIPLHMDCWLSPETSLPLLAFAGDSFRASRVESAALSGREAAKQLAERI